MKREREREREEEEEEEEVELVAVGRRWSKWFTVTATLTDAPVSGRARVLSGVSATPTRQRDLPPHFTDGCCGGLMQ